LDKKKAFDWLMRSASRGEMRAQHFLSLYFREGIAVPQDFKKAVYWALKAAEQGDPGSQFDMAIFWSLRSDPPPVGMRSHDRPCLPLHECASATA
jgi:TPR repeat protein